MTTPSKARAGPAGNDVSLVEVAALARAAGVAVVPHCPYFGPGLLASAHLLAAAPVAEPLEVYFADLDAPPYGEALAVRDGFVTLPAGPGLGGTPDW